MWLLVMTIPIQGFAAATMLSCESLHATPWAKTHAASTHVHHDDMHHIHHHDMVDTHQLASGASDTSHDASAHLEKPEPSSCSTCAACCIGAAVIPSSMAWTVVHNNSEQILINSEQILISPPMLATGHIPAGPERPPRA